MARSRGADICCRARRRLEACDTSDGRDETAETETLGGPDGAEGLDWYRLLAGVWDGPDIVGGAFWNCVDDDPFSGSHVVHPPNLSDESNLELDAGWGAGDYLWDETAALQPGTYQVDLWANPGELRPYGSYIPASPISGAAESMSMLWLARVRR